MKNEIIIYQSDDSSTSIEVRLEEETVWLNRQQISELFNRDIKTIGKYISNILKEELKGILVVAKIATTVSGKKWFAFSKINIDTNYLINKLAE